MQEPIFRYVDPLTLTSVEAAMSEVDRVLAHMQRVAASLEMQDMASGEPLDWFAAHTDWIKGYFERAEALVVANE